MDERILVTDLPRRPVYLNLSTRQQGHLGAGLSGYEYFMLVRNRKAEQLKSRKPSEKRLAHDPMNAMKMPAHTNFLIIKTQSGENRFPRVECEKPAWKFV